MHSRLFVMFLLFLSTSAARAQVKVQAQECGLKSLQVCALHVAQDEVGIVTAPFHLSAPSYFWLLPFGAATGIAVDKDNEAMQAVGFDTSRQNKFRRISDYGGLYGPAASVAVGYIAGSVTHNDHLKETAVLAGEAMADSIILNTGLGYAIDRQTPMQGNGRGDFWPHGTGTWPDGQSMPSDHSILVWSFAHVVASQYSGIATRLIVYSLATTVSASRVMAREHFPSDVFVGAALGYVIGGYVVERRTTDSAWNHFSMSVLRTPIGNGVQLSYAFSR
jgi:membrane-associated phospholipid phosphatase